MINNIRRFGSFFKLRHIPTGLYYIPLNFKLRCNLSKFGKLYNVRPKLFENKNSFYYNKRSEKLPIILSEWEIVEVLIIESNKVNARDDYERRLNSKNS